MRGTISTQAVLTTNDRAGDGRFAKGNPGGPGNPFARQTAALRAFLLNHVTERDLQDILDILLLNAKGGHLPSIKLLFSYVLGKPKPVVEPDLLDLQEMQMLQQSAVPAEVLETLCEQLPLEVQVQLTRFSQADKVAQVVEAAHEPGPTAVKSLNAPSTNGDNGEPGHQAAREAPSTNGFCKVPEVARPEKPPSTNGKTRRPPRLAGFAWLGKLQRAINGRAPT